MNSTSFDNALDRVYGDATMLPEYWGSWFIPIDGGNMNKLQLVIFYQFGAHTDGIRRIVTGESAIDTYMKLSVAERWLSTFRVEASNIPMPNAKRAVRELYDYVHSVSSRLFQNMQQGGEDAPVTLAENLRLKDLLTAFEQEFEHDSRDLNIFSVSDIGTHSTTKLLENAHLNLSADVRAKLSAEVIEDIKAAGRCLGFNTPTAAGFHILRAVEPLILAYHNKITGTALPVRSRSWGTYINRLRSHGGDPKIINMIDHIREFYRNPIMHPEETLTPDQALSLFYTCLSAIVQLDTVI